jgi:phage baseplate assembly protein W
MAKAFSIEDGNLSNVSAISSRTTSYKDIDLTFQAKSSGDVYKKTDAAAVKQAIKNLLLTGYYEKPFRPGFGGGLNDFLFDITGEYDENDIQERIIDAIKNYEPRAICREVNVNIIPEANKADITVVFQVRSTNETVTVDLSLTRLR